MGTFQNLFNQMLATGVAGVALGQHTAHTREANKQGALNIAGKTAEDIRNFNKEVVSSVVEADKLNLAIEDLQKQNQALNDQSLKMVMGKRPYIRNQQEYQENYEAIQAYANRLRELHAQAEGLQKTKEILQERAKMAESQLQKNKVKDFKMPKIR